METSSPLASLQPNHPGTFGQRCKEYNSHFLAPGPYDPRNFNFKDMSMMKSRPDYFNFNPVRGSSPTTSLAADLSQNFHIENSPAFPTPRRTLFNYNSSLSNLRGPRDVITPPIPSSSPGPDDSHMEATPLPHKPPYLANTSAPLDLPTPDPTPMEDAPIEPPSSAVKPDPTPSSRPASGHHRRISNGTRPSLRKGYSVNYVNSKPNGTAQVPHPPFVFGPGMHQPPKPILEDFVDSPPSERKLPCSNSTSDLTGGNPIPKLILNPDNGSPVAPTVRRASNARPPLARFGLIGRRTQSMQGTQPARPMRSEKRCCTEGDIPPTVDTQKPLALALPHFKSQNEDDHIPHITRETAKEVIDGVHVSKERDVIIIDCRFPFEYEGGHINGARSFNDKDALAGELFNPAYLPAPERSALDYAALPVGPRPKTLILHCEFSQKRAPEMAKHIRHLDRSHNIENYPYLSYPEMYILDGGFKSFHDAYQQTPYCVGSYVTMLSKHHEEAAELGMAKVRKRNKTLTRASTYAFGQTTTSQPFSSIPSTSFEPMPMLEDSPMPNIPAAPFPRPTTAKQQDDDAMDLDDEMDDAAKRRSITFDSPCIALSQGSAPRWLSRNPSY